MRDPDSRDCTHQSYFGSPGLSMTGKIQRKNHPLQSEVNSKGENHESA